MSICNEDNFNVDFLNLNYVKVKEYIDTIKDDFINFLIDRKQIEKIISSLKSDNRKNIQKLAANLLTFVALREKEIDRVKKMYDFDKKYLITGCLSGVDEVGRGPLAGPIVAASVVLDLEATDDKNLLLGIKDSKKLSAKKREELAKLIKEKAISYSISSIDNKSIDDKGIAWCNNEVFKIAIEKLKIQPDFVISDGYPIKTFTLPNNYVIKGDEKSASIACASIIAKVYRDNIMKEYAKLYPYYSFEQNAGYGTKEHIEAIKKYGPCEIHRLCFLTNIL